MMFTMVQVLSVYNTILKCPRMKQLDVFVSTKCLLVSFPIVLEIDEMHGNQQLTQPCYQISPKAWRHDESIIADHSDQRESKKRDEPIEELLSFPLKDDPARTVQSGPLCLHLIVNNS